MTVRAVAAGMLLGGFMSLSNLYVALKTGWSIGVSITASILAFAIFVSLFRLRLIRREFGMLENNIMKSAASAAGYMTGGGTVAAIPALMMITGEVMGGWQMFFWIATIGLLGVVMAIPMKQQMINVEQLRFPTGIATAETLRALHGEEGRGGQGKAKLLGYGSLAGAVVAFWRDAKVSWIAWNLPEKIKIPLLTLSGRPLVDYTLSFEGSLIMLGAGAIMGLRVAWSMLLGALINFGVLAPWLYSKGIIDPKLGYKNIVAWSVWFGSAMLLTSGLLSFALQWKTVVRAVKSVGSSMGGRKEGEEAVEVPVQWFFAGLIALTPIVVFLEWLFFDIKLWMGLISVAMSFFIAIVACRVTGETDTTPTGALGKITQITFGVLDPGNTTTNLMTANVTGGIGLHSADLLTDLKSGYLLKADPRQQFWAQLFGVLAGSCFVVPAYRLLIPTADVLGSDRWPAPGAQTWKGVAQLLAKGFHTLHPTAQWSLFIGGALGIVLVILEKWVPKWKKFIPSPAGLGLAFTTPANNTISMFLGAALALWLEKKDPKAADRLVVPVSSGFIAGESLIGVLLAALVVLGLM
ncbi:MAG: OPT/YSL family transporter [Elusimicrobia bacterium]|nr:OPT/YSL family transporter [Elusimicrobiota bacterium]